MNNLIDNAFQEAINVLKVNSTKIGFSASFERSDNYYSVWARDHSICSIASILSKEKDLIEVAKNGLLVLLKNQSESGQLPSYIEIENRKKIYGGLGAITSIDSNMWVLIASAMMYKYTKDKRFISKTNLFRYRKLNLMLKSFDSNQCGLLEVHVAGDWADIFNRNYHVLYDECLYYQALKALIFLFENGLNKIDDDVLKKKLKKNLKISKKNKFLLKRKINTTFWFTEENIEKIFEEYMIFQKPVLKSFDYYQSHLVPFNIYWQNRFDSFGNILAIISGVANKEKSSKIINYVLEKNINNPFPLTSLFPPVVEREKDWEPIYSKKEKPFTYHNGGIWPLIAGFWVFSLTKLKKRRTALKELELFASILKRDEWLFPEYYNGLTGEAMGKNYQAWSAAGYIIAYKSFKEKTNFFNYK
ncbi:MAG: glycoside hydrolase 100 family protein [Candidatus ainarchaeum sp.]|nr:glycoside hydrolase 100 family protein [Candidatus ainarchaeum sp.]